METQSSLFSIAVSCHLCFSIRWCICKHWLSRAAASS